MEKRTLIIISSVLIFIIVLFAVLIVVNRVLMSPSVSELEKCNTLIENTKTGINLVFFSDKETAEKYSDYLFGVSPFNVNKNKFNVYYIDSYIPECSLYKGIALFCYSKELIRKAASCPNDFIIALDSRETQIRSSSYMNVLSLNENHPLSVFAHEFGHSFVSLAEEYYPSSMLSGAKNCVSNCDEFSVSNGCFKGCSSTELYRSIENGIMKTLSASSYGKFDESIISNRILKVSGESVITGNVISDGSECQNEKYYLVEGNYSNGSVKILSNNIAYGCFGSSGNGDFSYKLTSETGIKEDIFNPELIFTDSPGGADIEGEDYMHEGKFYLKVPLQEKGELELLKNNVTLASVKLDNNGARPCKI